MKKYAAPWSNSLVYISAFATLVCLGTSVSVVLRGGWWMATVANRRSAVAYESGSFR